MNTTPQSEATIEVAGLDHWFGVGEGRKQVLFGIDLAVQRGGITILMGPSGSGKTTLLTLMGCLREVQQGSVRVLGTELSGLDVEGQQTIRQRVGFIFQAHNLHNSLTAHQNVLMGLRVSQRRSPKSDRERADDVLSALGLAERLDYLPAQLSGGQKQRVAIARALAAEPEIVFADEPTAALDHASGMNVVAMLRDLGRATGLTTVMVTHDPRVLEFADRVVSLQDGRLIS